MFKQIYAYDKYQIVEYEINDATSNYEKRDVKFTINLTELDSDMLFIRFGASGKYDDDWMTNERIYTIKVGEV